MNRISWFTDSDWWHLGMAGKLPEFLCPVECVDTQDFVGLDYYWGISTLELHRMHQLIDASLSNFFGAPVDPPGLLRVLRRFHRWFPEKEILIIENGCIESADGFTRPQYLSFHLDQLQQAQGSANSCSRIYLLEYHLEPRVGPEIRCQQRFRLVSH